MSEIDALGVESGSGAVGLKVQRVGDIGGHVG